MEEKKRKQVDRIEKALGIAHREQTVQGLSPEWREAVMRHIRRLHADTQAKQRKPSTAPAFQKMLFPAATATGLVAIALLAYLLTALPGMDQDLFAALTQDPSGFVVTQELGM